MRKDARRDPADRVVGTRQGFTLIELLTTLSVVSILAVVAIPNMSIWVQDSRLSETHHRLQSTLSLARIEAVRRGAYVVLCASADGQTCMGDARSGKSIWSHALLFMDQDQDRIYTASKDELIRVVDLEQGAQVLWNRGDSTVYEGNGSLLGGANGSFYIFNEANTEVGGKLVLQMTGRVRYTDFSKSDQTKLEGYLSQLESSG